MRKSFVVDNRRIVKVLVDNTFSARKVSVAVLSVVLWHKDWKSGRAANS